MSEGLSRLAQAAALLFLSGYCEKSQYGELGLLFSIHQGLVVLILGGYVEAATGVFSQQCTSADLSHTIERLRKSMNLVGSAVCLVYGFWIVLTATVPIASPAEPLAIQSAALVTSAFLSARLGFASGVLRLQARHRSAILTKCLPVALGFPLAALGCVVFNDRSMGFALGLLTGHTVVSLFCGRLQLHNWAGHHLMITHRKIWSITTPFLVVTLIGYFSGYGNNLFIDWLIDSRAIADFTLTTLICSSLLLVPQAINQTWTPRFYQLVHTAPRSYTASLNSIVEHFGSLLLSSFAALTISLVPTLLSVGPRNFASYANLAGNLTMMSLGYLVLSPHAVSVSYFLAYKEGRTVLRLTIYLSVIGTTASVLLMWWLGEKGIYIGFVLLMLLRGTALYSYASRRWSATVFWPGIFLNFALVITAYLLTALVPSLIGRMALVCVGIATVVAISWRARARDIQEHLGVCSLRELSKAVFRRQFAFIRADAD